MGVEDNVSQQLQPLFEDPPEWKLPQQQKDEIYKARRTVGNLVSKRKLPKDYEIEVAYPKAHVYSPEGKVMPLEQEVRLKHRGDIVGTVRWRADTGHVDWLGVDEPHRVTGTAHLWNAAHEWSAKEGGIGPRNANNMTHYSAALAKKYLPSSIPDTAKLPTRPTESQARAHSIIRATEWAGGYLEGAKMSLKAAYGEGDIPAAKVIPEGHPAANTLAHLNRAQVRIKQLNSAMRDVGSAHAPETTRMIHEELQSVADQLQAHPDYTTGNPHYEDVRNAIDHINEIPHVR